MKLVNYNRPFPTDIFRFFDDHATRAAYEHRPAVNIIENDDAFELELLAPGLDKNHFDVALEDGQLRIAYHKETSEETQVPNYRRREFRSRNFVRTFQLDDTVINDEAIAADYVDGVLKLTLPKREEALPKAPRKIAIA